MLQEPKDKNCGSPIPAQDGALLAEAIEAVEFGIMLVAGDCFIIFANTIARELMRLGEGLQANVGWVAATSADITQRLRQRLRSRRFGYDSARPPPPFPFYPERLPEGGQP